MAKKKNDITNWRNDKKSIFEILGDNKKYLMPAILAVAVVITIIIAIGANKKATEVASTGAVSEEASTIEIADVTMEENAYPEVNALVEKYYTASANGDADTLSQIYKGLDETEILKAVAASEYIESFENITVYTKPGPKDGSYVAYVYNEVKLYEYDGFVPGLETLYICSDESGNLYINGDIADASELDYLKQVNVQSDVIDLNNKVASSYNEMVSADEKLAELLTRMRSGLQVSVGEALATSEASTPDESTDAASAEESVDDGTTTITTRVIKATDVINIRSSDSETADILDKTTVGQEFKELEALANGWSKVEYKNSVAYVKTEFFEVVSEETVVVENTKEETEDDAATDASSKDASASASSSASSAASDSASTGASSKDSASSSSSTAASSAASTASSSKTVTNAKTGNMTVKESVRLRKEQSTDSDILETLYGGTEVDVIENYSNGWSKVKYKKQTGYIKTEFLQ